jgi:hypothetical protein
MLGEVVSALNKNADVFTSVKVREGSKIRTHTFVNSLTSGGDAVAEVITAQFLLTGPTTPVSRGIRIHGTNRVNQLGKRGSGGCIRESNVDMYDLFNYVDVGSPVMIAATKLSPEEVARERKKHNLMEATPEREAPRKDIRTNLMDRTSGPAKKPRNLMDSGN